MYRDGTMMPGVKAVVGLIVGITLVRLLWQWVTDTALPWIGDHPWLRGHEVSGQAPNRVVLNKETRKKWRHPVRIRRSSARTPSRSR